MKKISLSFYCITLMLICQVILAPVASVSAAELSEEQIATVVEKCDEIRTNLVKVQRNDARARVYLGRYYELILTNFITPLNVRLVENNISNTGLIENQSNFVERRAKFNEDYIGYQQGLEELTGMDCKAEPVKFYSRLEAVREQRARVRRDVEKMRGLADEQVKLVEELKATLGGEDD